jgi:hypothetical protein
VTDKYEYGSGFVLKWGGRVRCPTESTNRLKLRFWTSIKMISEVYKHLPGFYDSKTIIVVCLTNQWTLAIFDSVEGGLPNHNATDPHMYQLYIKIRRTGVANLVFGLLGVFFLLISVVSCSVSRLADNISM